MLCFTISGFATTSMPPTLADPDVGASRPQRIRMVVDFPAPFGPKKPKISPGATRIDTWSTATKSPNRFTRLSISTVALDGCMILLRFANQRNENILKRRLNFFKRLHVDARRPHGALDGGRRRSAREKQMQRRPRGLNARDLCLFLQDLPRTCAVRRIHTIPVTS